MQGQRPACSHFVSPETEEYFGSGRLPIQLIGHWLQVATGLVPFSLQFQAMAAFPCICRSDNRACALRLLVAPVRSVEWRSCCFLSPYHGVLAVKGCMRFAHLRPGRLSPPDCCAVLDRFRAIPPEQLEHDHVAAFSRL